MHQVTGPNTTHGRGGGTSAHVRSSPVWTARDLPEDVFSGPTVGTGVELDLPPPHGSSAQTPTKVFALSTAQEGAKQRNASLKLQDKLGAPPSPDPTEQHCSMLLQTANVQSRQPRGKFFGRPSLEEGPTLHKNNLDLTPPFPWNYLPKHCDILTCPKRTNDLHPKQS